MIFLRMVYQICYFFLLIFSLKMMRLYTKITDPKNISKDYVSNLSLKYFFTYFIPNLAETFTNFLRSIILIHIDSSI